MISLQELIGKEIPVFVPMFHATNLQKLKLLNVEPGEIWVENRKISDLMLKQFGFTYSPKSVVFFLPYHQISFALGSLDEPYISDEALK
jgi:hypothetical protein